MVEHSAVLLLTFWHQLPHVLAPAVELIVQDFHGLALSSLAVVVPMPTMMLELQSAERIMLVSSLVDLDARQLRVSAT
jgi:hypothetical protein